MILLVIILLTKFAENNRITKGFREQFPWGHIKGVWKISNYYLLKLKIIRKYGVEISREIEFAKSYNFSR